MEGTHLTGLEGTNPLGFLAALGVQTIFDLEAEVPRLRWSDDVIPHAMVDPRYTVERIAEHAMRVFPSWRESSALEPGLVPTGDVKFEPGTLRAYLTNNREPTPVNALATALVAEGSLDGNGVAKPTDLYFTAGRQLFLRMACEILQNVTVGDVANALSGPWPYTSELPSLMWDVTDDRIYALAAYDPASEKKLSNPGAEALALVGLARYPVFAGKNRTLTQGFSGSWKRGWYTWPLWDRPAGSGAVRSLLAHASIGPDSHDGRISWYPSWGVTVVLRAAVRRSDQGGYGTFTPPEVVWQR